MPGLWSVCDLGAEVIDWDHVAREWIAGRLEPSIGRDAWSANARGQAQAIASIVAPYAVSTLVEVGSGIGRLTPHLAERFEDVIAIDTSAGMTEATELAIANSPHAVVSDYREGDAIPIGDAALVWDVIGSDWSLQQADALVDACLRSCLLVLVSVSRLSGWSPDQNLIVREGDGWWLLRAEVV